MTALAYHVMALCAASLVHMEGHRRDVIMLEHICFVIISLQMMYEFFIAVSQSVVEILR